MKTETWTTLTIEMVIIGLALSIGFVYLLDVWPQPWLPLAWTSVMFLAFGGYRLARMARARLGGAHTVPGVVSQGATGVAAPLAQPSAPAPAQPASQDIAPTPHAPAAPPAQATEPVIAEPVIAAPVIAAPVVAAPVVAAPANLQIPDADGAEADPRLETIRGPLEDLIATPAPTPATPANPGPTPRSEDATEHLSRAELGRIAGMKRPAARAQAPKPVEQATPPAEEEDMRATIRTRDHAPIKPIKPVAPRRAPQENAAPAEQEDFRATIRTRDHAPIKPIKPIAPHRAPQENAAPAEQEDFRATLRTRDHAPLHISADQIAPQDGKRTVSVDLNALKPAAAARKEGNE